MAFRHQNKKQAVWRLHFWSQDLLSQVVLIAQGNQKQVRREQLVQKQKLSKRVIALKQWQSLTKTKQKPLVKAIFWLSLVS